MIRSGPKCCRWISAGLRRLGTGLELSGGGSDSEVGEFNCKGASVEPTRVFVVIGGDSAVLGRRVVAPEIEGWYTVEPGMMG